MPQEWGRKIPVKYIQKIFQIYSIRQRTWLNSKSCTQPFYQWIFHSPISRWRVPVINKKKKIYIYRCMLHHFWKNNNSFSIFFESSSTIFDRIFFFLFFYLKIQWWWFRENKCIAQNFLETRFEGYCPDRG